MQIQQQIEQKLRAEFAPLHLEVENESHMHNVPEGSESHFKIVLVTDKFSDKPLLQRHRAVNGALSTELAGQIHALALHTMTPDEWYEKGGAAPDSPPCLGWGQIMILNLIRWPLGQLILLIDFLTAPRKPEREPAEQAAIDTATRNLALYQFKACPFCVKTRRAMRRLGLNIETRDARNDPRWREQLLTEGGRLQVPCLYDSDKNTWLYESKDIIAFLEQQVSQTQTAI